ncbi:hypothetical protein BT10792_25810 [Bacillus thuringiensis]|nr:hypothetical protein BT10792_25810 [Bacillus thuringiensis]
MYFIYYYACCSFYRWLFFSKEESKAKEQPKTKVVKHAKGEATIPVNPKRIVDLSGSTEELLLLGHKPVGTANTYKDKIQNHLTDKLDGVKAVGWYWAPKVDLEAVTALKPDLIILNNRQLKIYDQLEKVAPTVVLETNLEDWRGKFKEVGKLFDEEKKADKWIADYDKKADSLSKKLKRKQKMRTLCSLQLHLKTSVYTAASDTVTSSLTT